MLNLQISAWHLLHTLLLLFSMSAVAQDIQQTALKWNVNELNDLNSNESFQYTCNFVTYGDSIRWNQTGSGMSVTMNVASVEGQWSDVSSVGKITCSIGLYDKAGTIEFSRTSDGVFITLLVSPAEPNGINHRYKVKEVEVK